MLHFLSVHYIGHHAALSGCKYSTNSQYSLTIAPYYVEIFYFNHNISPKGECREAGFEVANDPAA